jgi:hypothetical protein
MPEIFDEHMSVLAASRVSPEARKIIEKHFGKDCFKCPSFPGEPLFMGARMHSLDLEILLRELNGTLA